MTKKKLEREKEMRWLKQDLENLQRYIDEFASFLPIAVCDVTLIGIITFVNKAFQKLTNYKEIDIVGEPVKTIFLEKRKTEKIINEILKKDTAKTIKLTLLSKQKNKIPVSMVGSARKDRKGNIIGYFLAIIDISESEKFQEELEQRVQERTKELQGKIQELEKIHRLIVGRELKMIELKKEIKKLQKE